MLTSDSNKKISNRAPSDYLRDVEEAAKSIGADVRAWLDLNLISPEAFEAAKSDDFERFLSLRAQTIHANVLGLAGWEEDVVEAPEIDLDEDDSEMLSAAEEDPDYVFEPPKANAVAGELSAVT